MSRACHVWMQVRGQQKRGGTKCQNAFTMEKEKKKMAKAGPQTATVSKFVMQHCLACVSEINLAQSNTSCSCRKILLKSASKTSEAKKFSPAAPAAVKTCRSEGFLLWGSYFFLEVQAFLSIKHPDLNNAKIPLKPSDLKLLITGKLTS